jgi:hypothetical protein
MSAPTPAQNRIAILQRAPRRISINVSHDLFRRLQEMADQQGRSTSNLCAYLLERMVDAKATEKPAVATFGPARRAEVLQR